MISHCEPVPALRRVLFSVLTRPGLTFGGGSILIQRGTQLHERGRGHVVETMPGHYFYELHPAEVSEPGPLVLLVRVPRDEDVLAFGAVDQRTPEWLRIPVQITVPLGDPEEPAAWADVHVEPGQNEATGEYLTRLALDRGVTRRPGETDAELRERVRALWARTSGGFTERDLETAVRAGVQDVVDCTVETRQPGEIVVAVRIRCEHIYRPATPDRQEALERARQRIEEELRVAVEGAAPAGIRVRVALTLVGA